MEWLKSHLGKSVALDTAPLIYFIEEHPVYGPVVEPFFSAVADGEIRAVTSTITLAEVLVHPLKRGDEALAQKYHDILLSSEHVSVVPVTFRTCPTCGGASRGARPEDTGRDPNRDGS